MMIKIQPFIIAAFIGIFLPQHIQAQKPFTFYQSPSNNDQYIVLSQPIAGQVLFTEDFESGSSFPVNGITTSTQGTDGGFKIGTVISGGWPVPPTSSFAYTNDDNCNCDKSQDILLLPNQDFSMVASAVLEFDVFHDMNAGEGSLYIEIDTGNGFTAIDSIPAKNDWQFFQTPLPNVQGKASFAIRFLYGDNGAWATGVAIDNIEIKEPNNEYDLGLAAPPNFPSLAQIPASHAFGRLLEQELIVSNLGKKSTQGIQVIGEVSGEAKGKSEFAKSNLGTGKKLSISAQSPYIFPDKMGQYNISYYPYHDSVSGSVDTVSSTIYLTDTLMSYDMGNYDTVGLWFGSGNTFRISTEFTFNKPDTISSVYVYIHENTAKNSRIDVDIYNSINQPIIPSAFPQSNLNFNISDKDIGSYVLIPIPKTPVEKGDYRVSILTRTDSVVLSCATLPYKSSKSSLRIGTNVTTTRYLPIIGVNMLGTECALTLQPTTTLPSCGLSDGSIKMSYTGNVGTPSVRWEYQDTVIYNTDSIGQLPFGIYTAHVTDSDGCYSRAEIPLSNIGGPTIDSISLVPAGCFGSKQGKAMIHHQIGRGLQYRFESQTASTDSIFDTLVPGTYHIEAFDPSSPNCITTLVAEIEGGQTPLSADVQSHENFCYDDIDGSLSAKASGGTAPYTYKWLGVSVDSLPNQKELSSGKYPLEIMDAFQCVYRDTFKIGSQPRIQLAPKTDDDKGYIVLNASKNNEALTYSWSGPNGFKNPGTDSISGLFIQGNYAVTVTDEIGCRRDTAFQMGGTLSLGDDALSQTKVYPNPTNDLLNINSPTTKLLTLYNQNGQITLQQEIVGLASLSLGDLPKGLYLLHISGNSGDETFKIMLR